MKHTSTAWLDISQTSHLETLDFIYHWTWVLMECNKLTVCYSSAQYCLAQLTSDYSSDVAWHIKPYFSLFPHTRTQCSSFIVQFSQVYNSSTVYAEPASASQFSTVGLHSAELCSALGLPVFGDISLQVCSPSWLSQTSSGGPIHLKVLSVPLLYSSNTLSLLTVSPSDEMG